jgi:hypothetical protein
VLLARWGLGAYRNCVQAADTHVTCCETVHSAIRPRFVLELHLCFLQSKRSVAGRTPSGQSDVMCHPDAVQEDEQGALACATHSKHLRNFLPTKISHSGTGSLYSLSSVNRAVCSMPCDIHIVARAMMHMALSHMPQNSLCTNTLGAGTEVHADYDRSTRQCNRALKHSSSHHIS